MPGVVGATLRKKGHYASMRGQISHGIESSPETGKNGRVTVKLFNLIAKELGAELLEYGIKINGVDFKRFIDKLDKNFIEGIKSTQINETMVGREKLAETAYEGKNIILSVRKG